MPRTTETNRRPTLQQSEPVDWTVGIRLPNEVSIDELEPALRIDRNDIEGSLEVQADSFYRVAGQVVLATSRRDAARQYLAEVEAEADARLRHDASVAEEKITEKEIESEKKRDRNVIAAQQELLRLNTKLGMVSALKEAFIQRSYVLKDLCSLQINSLYSEHGSLTAGNRYREGLSSRARERMAEQRQERADNHEHRRRPGDLDRPASRRSVRSANH